MDFEEIQAAIQARGYGTDTADAQQSMINSVYYRVNTLRRWPFLEISGTQVVTPGVASYVMTGFTLTPTTDLVPQQVDSARLSLGNDTSLLTFIPQKKYQDYLHLDTVNGFPIYFTNLRNTHIAVYPRPDQAYTITAKMFGQPPALETGDSPVWPEQFHDVLTWGVVTELTFRERDAAGRQMAVEEYNKRLMDMLHFYGMRQKSNSTQVVTSGVHGDTRPEDVGLWLAP